MAEKFEDKHLDVLQNIEFALVSAYHAHTDMVDYDALDAINALIRAYQAEERNKSAPALKLNARAQAAYTAVRGVYEWRLGQETMSEPTGEPIDTSPGSKTLDEIIACLKRIRRSIELWNKQGGRRGYYTFVSQFVR